MKEEKLMIEISTKDLDLYRQFKHNKEEYIKTQFLAISEAVNLDISKERARYIEKIKKELISIRANIDRDIDSILNISTFPGLTSASYINSNKLQNLFDLINSQENKILELEHSMSNLDTENRKLKKKKRTWFNN